MNTPCVGDIGLTKGGGPAMALVRWATGVRHFSWGRFWRVPADFGHACVCVGPGIRHDEVLIVEATPKKVVMRFSKIDCWTWSTGGPFDDQLLDVRRVGIAELARDQVGKGYDWPPFVDFARHWWRSSYYGGDQDHPDDRLFCSELGVWVWREKGVIGLYDGKRPGPTTAWRAPGSIAPEDLKLVLPEELRNGWKAPT
jgi:hypothetical protein